MKDVTNTFSKIITYLNIIITEQNNMDLITIFAELPPYADHSPGW